MLLQDVNVTAGHTYGTAGHKCYYIQDINITTGHKCCQLLIGCNYYQLLDILSSLPSPPV